MSAIAIAGIIQAIISTIPDVEMLVQFVENLIAQRTALQTANRPDVADSDIAAMTAVIDGIQAHIDAKAAAAAV